MPRCVVCNRPSGNSFLVAQAFGFETLFAVDTPDLGPYEFVVLVCANTGDEELQPEMERFLLTLKTTGKRYAICELGNYFGYERDCFGCKKTARLLLDQLGWHEVSHVSIDSLPDLDIHSLQKWIQELHGLLNDN